MGARYELSDKRGMCVSLFISEMYQVHPLDQAFFGVVVNSGDQARPSSCSPIAY